MCWNTTEMQPENQFNIELAVTFTVFFTKVSRLVLDYLKFNMP